MAQSAVRDISVSSQVASQQDYMYSTVLVQVNEESLSQVSCPNRE